MTKEKEISKQLWNEPILSGKNAPSKEIMETILEQYKLCVEMADRISKRRDTANAFFLGINGAVMSIAPTLVEKGFLAHAKWSLVLPYLVLCLQLFFWWRLIVSYKALNGAKFQIIGAFEENLPARPYGKTEWDLLLKSGNDRWIYWPLTHIEMFVPWIFFGGYTIAVYFLMT